MEASIACRFHAVSLSVSCSVFVLCSVFVCFVQCLYLFRAVKNKQLLADSDLVDRILTVAQHAEFTPVIFKLLGTLRMLVSGQGQSLFGTLRMLFSGQGQSLLGALRIFVSGQGQSLLGTLRILVNGQGQSLRMLVSSQEQSLPICSVCTLRQGLDYHLIPCCREISQR